MKTVALLIAHQGYQAIEYGVTKDILIKQGLKVLTISNKPGIATAHDSSTTDVDLPLEKINLDIIEALFLIGGNGALDCLDNENVYHLLQEVYSLGIPYGSICIASRILAKAGVLGGKRATGWDGDNKLDQIFQEHAVIYVKKPVVVDGTIVTATGPQAAQEFAEEIVTVLRD